MYGYYVGNGGQHEEINKRHVGYMPEREELFINRELGSSLNGITGAPYPALQMRYFCWGNTWPRDSSGGTLPGSGTLQLLPDCTHGATALPAHQ